MLHCRLNLSLEILALLFTTYFEIIYDAVRENIVRMIDCKVYTVRGELFAALVWPTQKKNYTSIGTRLEKKNVR